MMTIRFSQLPWLLLLVLWEHSVSQSTLFLWSKWLLVSQALELDAFSSTSLGASSNIVPWLKPQRSRSSSAQEGLPSKQLWFLQCASWQSTRKLDLSGVQSSTGWVQRHSRWISQLTCSRTARKTLSGPNKSHTAKSCRSSVAPGFQAEKRARMLSKQTSSVSIRTQSSRTLYPCCPSANHCTECRFSLEPLAYPNRIDFAWPPWRKGMDID